MPSHRVLGTSVSDIYVPNRRNYVECAGNTKIDALLEDKGIILLNAS